MLSRHEMHTQTFTPHSSLVDFPDWARNMITINHLLVIVNSSFNFLIYCGDVVFRYTHKILRFRAFRDIEGRLL